MYSSIQKYAHHILAGMTLVFLCVTMLSVPAISRAEDKILTPGTKDTEVVNTPGTKTTKTEPVKLTNPLSDKFNSVGGLIQGFVVILSYLAVLAAVVIIIWIGFQFVLARGNPQRMNELKGWLFWVIIGVAVVIGARIIIQVVINTLAATGTVDQKVIQSAQNAVLNK